MDMYRVIVKGFPSNMKEFENKGVTISKFDRSIPSIPCVYFLYKTVENIKIPVYVGETSNLNKRISTICQNDVYAHNEGKEITYFPENNKKRRLHFRKIIKKFFYQGF